MIYITTIRPEHESQLIKFRNIMMEGDYARTFGQKKHTRKQYFKIAQQHNDILAWFMKTYQKEIQEAGFDLTKGDVMNLQVLPNNVGILSYNQGEMKMKREGVIGFEK